MNGIESYDWEPAMEPDGITELVRGNEVPLLERMTPLVCRDSVRLDMRHVERIDAAGVAALIALYRAAREAGHRFGVVNPRPHVAEILGLLGLDRVLMGDEAEVEGHCRAELVRSAA